MIEKTVKLFIRLAQIVAFCADDKLTMDKLIDGWMDGKNTIFEMMSKRQAQTLFNREAENFPLDSSPFSEEGGGEGG